MFVISNRKNVKQVKTEIIRAYLLEKGDQFILQGRIYRVLSNDGEKVRYSTWTNYDQHNTYGTVSDMSAASRERLILICKLPIVIKTVINNQ
jgi:Lhr-like helicase